MKGGWGTYLTSLDSSGNFVSQFPTLDHLWNGNNLPDQELLVPDTFGCAGRGDSELGMGSWELEIGSLGPYLLHTKHLPERQIYYPKKCYSSL